VDSHTRSPHTADIGAVAVRLLYVALDGNGFGVYLYDSEVRHLSGPFATTEGAWRAADSQARIRFRKREAGWMDQELADHLVETGHLLSNVQRMVWREL
jgi:hypothetical protein